MNDVGDRRLQQLAEHRRVLTEYFSSMNLVPVTVAADQQIGDVYDVKRGWAFVSAGQECFPGLGNVKEVDSSLPDTIDLAEAQISSALGLSRLFRLSGRGSNADTVKLRFTGVRIRRVSEHALRAGVCQTCEHLNPILAGTMEPYDERGPRYVLVGTVVFARKEVFVGLTGDASVAIDADVTDVLGAASVTAVELNAKMSAGFGFGSRRGCLLQSEKRLPVALGLAFYPEIVYDRVQGGGTGQEEPVAIQWFGAEKNPPSQRLLADLSASLPLIEPK